MNAGIYVRISRDRESEEHGIHRQEEDCRRLAESLGWDVVAVYSDNDTSATSGKPRKRWLALLEDISAGRIDAILAYSSSRMYRRPRDLEPLKKLKPEIKTVVSGTINLNTADERMLAGILAEVDQAEAERTAERIRRQKSQARDKGRWLGGGSRPYGYDRRGDPDPTRPGHLIKIHHVINEVEARVIKECVQRALDGDSLGRITLDLNRRGIKTAGDGLWRTTNLRRLLSGPFQAGLSRAGKPGQHRAIITETQHLLLRAKFPERDHPIGRGKGPREEAIKTPLSGIVVCELCGVKMHGVSGGRYRCPTANGGCGQVSIKRDPVDAFVEAEIYNRRDAWERLSERHGKRIDAGPLAEERRTEEEYLESLRVMLGNRLIDKDDFRVAREQVRRRIAALDEQLAEITPRFVWTASDTWRRFAELAVLPDEERGTIDPAELRALALTFIDHIIVSKSDRKTPEPDRLEIVWNS